MAAVEPRPLDPPSDALAQVHAASQGDSAAVETLLAQFRPALERHIAANAGRLVLARETPDDLAQSVCREVLEKLRTGRFQFLGEAAFREWVHRAALMKLVDRQRRWTAQRRDVARESPIVGMQSSDSAANEPAITNTPSRAFEQREEFERFERAYGELPERQREVLRLHHVDGLPHADIATALGISEANSRMLLSRALARIGRLLADA